MKNIWQETAKAVRMTRRTRQKEEEMLNSMTGFGRCECSNDKYKVTVEMKAVNHRYFDLNIKMPRKFNAFESAVRTALKEYIQRGKVDVFITYEDFSEETVDLKYNESIAREYMDIFRRMEDTFGFDREVTAVALARMPEVITMGQAEEDEETLLKLLLDTVRGSAEKFVKTRQAEGEQLKTDLIGKLTQMLLWLDEIEKRSPVIVEEYKTRLREKIREVLEERELEEARVLTEITIFADKICVDEETVRLRSHIAAMKEALLTGGPVGRKLDFIAQEMNREANTILSKSNDIEISSVAIDLKTEIEKIREQVQNIE